MIRVLEEKDVDIVAKIWLETNIKAHVFVASNYWKEHYEMVKDMFLQAEAYVYEIEKEIMGFIGLDKEYIEGIFVLDQCQKRGIGKALLNHVKAKKEHLSLNVYQKILMRFSFIKEKVFVFNMRMLIKILVKKNIGWFGIDSVQIYKMKEIYYNIHAF